MIRILIVEDEPPIARDLANIIDQWKDEYYQIVDVVYNGLAAMEKIQKEKIDILLVDINMPGMNGLELIQWTKVQGYSMETIIISGYNDFKYAKEAMSYGIKHYILKPIQVEELKEIMQLVKQNILIEKIQHMPRNEVIYQEGKRRKKEKNQFLVVLGCIGYFTEENTMVDSLKQQLVHAFPSNLVVDSLINYCKNLWYFYQPDGTFVMLMNVGEAPIREKLPLLLEKSIESSPSKMTYIFSLPLNEFTEMKEKINQLKQCLKDSVEIGKDKVLGEEAYIGIVETTFNQLTIQVILERMKTDKTALVTFLQEQMEVWKKENRCQQYIVDQLQFLFTSFNLQQIPADRNGVAWKRELVNTVKVTSYESFYKRVLQLGEKISQYKTVEDYYENNLEVAHRIEVYIRQHIEEPLSNIVLSKEFGLTPAYLSKIFKEYAGVSPIDFIINIRIELAKQLFVQYPHLLTKEIALKVGYEDPYYFSKLFKKKTGISPANYKKYKAE